MNKIDSLEFLENNHFNILPYIIYTDYTPEEEILFDKEEEIVRSVEELGRGPYSARTQPKDSTCVSFKHPFRMNMDIPEIVRFVKEHSSEYRMIIYKTLDSEDCIVKGTIAQLGGEKYIELVEGPGIVRDLDKSEVISFDIKEPFPTKLEHLLYIIKEVIDRGEAIFYHFASDEDIVVEWSYYKYPVGNLKRNLVFWEVR